MPTALEFESKSPNSHLCIGPQETVTSTSRMQRWRNLDFMDASQGHSSILQRKSTSGQVKSHNRILSCQSQDQNRVLRLLGDAAMKPHGPGRRQEGQGGDLTHTCTKSKTKGYPGNEATTRTAGAQVLAHCSKTRVTKDPCNLSQHLKI